jgi:glutamate synthase domain-containing protein 2
MQIRRFIFSVSNYSCSFRLSKAAKMPAVSKVAIEISEDFDVQVLDDGIEASPHIYLYHHPEVANRIYSAKNVTGSKTQVIVKELNLVCF